MKVGITKLKKIFTVIIWSVLIVISLNITVKADEVIPSSEFEDENFYKYIIENFDTNGDGLLQQSEAEAVTDISISSNEYVTKVRSVKGIEHFTNLEIFNGGYVLESLEPIRNLTKIWYLYIWSDLITDFSPIYDFQLRILYMDSTKIQDIGFLTKDMSYMNRLHLSNCGNITDFSALLELTELPYIDLSGCKNFKDITVLKNMKKLYALNLENTDITDFSMLSIFENMVTLNLGRTGIKK